ncbi:MAG: heme exporter protein CcmB [Gammaproteobacteria bacterium]
MTRSALGLAGSLGTTLQRELQLAFSSPGRIVNPLMFFVIAVSMFPLGGRMSAEVLGTIAAGVIWVTALLAVMLSMESLFRSDFDDGSLEQLLLSPQPLYFHLQVKVLAHWLVTGLPLVVISPLLGLLLHLPEAGYGPLMLGLLLGTPALSMIAAIGTALTVGLARSGLLLAVLVLPLSIPVLVFGAGLVDTALNGLPLTGLVAVLAALLVLAGTLAPLAIGAALRISVH